MPRCVYMFPWGFVKPNRPNLSHHRRLRRRLKRASGKDFLLTVVPSFVYMSVVGIPTFVIPDGAPEGGKASP